MTIELWMTNLAEWRSCGVVLGCPRKKATLSPQALVEGGCPSSSQKCLSVRLRCEQQPSDHQAGMRGRVACHQTSSDRKSHVSETQKMEKRNGPSIEP